MNQQKSVTFPKLKTGYAFSSTLRSPRDPETVLVGEAEVESCKFVGQTVIDGAMVNSFKVIGKNRYYFQICGYSK